MLTEAREQARAGEHDAATQALDDLLARFGADPDSAIREGVGRALRLLWAVKTKQGQHRDAEAIADRILEEFADQPRVGSGELDFVAAALLAKGRSSRAQGEAGRALEAFDRLIDEYGTAQEPDVKAAVDSARAAKGDLLGELGRGDNGADALYRECLNLYRQRRYAEAVSAADTLLERYSENGPPGALAEALWIKSRSFAEGPGGREQELTALSELATRYADSHDAIAKLIAARGAFNQGVLLRAMGRPRDAAEVLDQIFRRYRSDPPAEEPLLAMRALYAELESLVSAGEIAHAQRCAEELTGLLAGAGDATARVETARRVTRAGELLHHAGAYASALHSFEAVASELLESADPEARAWAVRAQVGAGMALSRLGRVDDALAANRSIFAVGEPALEALEGMSQEAEAGGSRERLAWLLLMTAGVLEELGRMEERDAALASIVERFGDDLSPFVAEVVSAARRG